jgi:hypothetical protein
MTPEADFMICISWMLVSYLAAAMVILASPDQPEQAIDTERSSLTVHSEKRGCSPPPPTNTGSMRRSQAEPIKIGGGVVRVKDELEISFRVYAASR